MLEHLLFTWVHASKASYCMNLHIDCYLSTIKRKEKPIIGCTLSTDRQPSFIIMQLTTLNRQTVLHIHTVSTSISTSTFHIYIHIYIYIHIHIHIHIYIHIHEHALFSTVLILVTGSYF